MLGEDIAVRARVYTINGFIGRVLIAFGRDAADVPITHTFGPNTLTGSRVAAE